MKLEPERYVWDDEFEGGCAVYPHDTYPGEAKGMYSKEQINELLKSIIDDLKEDPFGNSVRIVSNYILE